MSRHNKKDKKNKGSGNSGPQASRDQSQGSLSKVPRLQAEAADVYGQATARNPVAADGVLAAVLNAETSATPGLNAAQTLEQSIAQAQAAIAVFETEQKTLSELRVSLDAQSKDLAEREAVLEQRVQECESEVTRTHTRTRELLAREEAVAQREADAEAGFLEKQREWLHRFEIQRAQVLTDLENERHALSEERSRLATEFIARSRVEEERATEERLRRVHEQHARDLELDAREARLAKDASRVRLDRELIDEDKSALDDRLSTLVAREREAVAAELTGLRNRLDRSLGECDRLTVMLQAQQHLSRRLGDREPEAIIRELDDLRRERDSLKEQIARRPSGDIIGKLAEYEQTIAALSEENRTVQHECGVLRSQVSRALVAATEMESLRNERESYRVANENAKQINTKLRADLQQSLEDVRQVTPFKTCTERDEDHEYQSEPDLRAEFLPLDSLVTWLQNRIASVAEAEQILYYSRRDLRAFVAGLAMSRLHILQGVSGTGKTSLAKAFARAVGGGVAIVEVQAGWRDRQDLVGYYNSFERRFYEQKFLMALYDAQCPKFAGRPFFVILDEMNLSHPEQYAADLLSQLEQDRQERRIELMTFVPQGAPKRLVGGRFLSIPENVWFVGTANHDETTRDFADKTYDRAHVLELPTRPEKIEAKPEQLLKPLAYTYFAQSFAKAKASHPGAGVKVFDHFQEHLARVLGDGFGIGWGSRLLRQLDAFVPVYMATGRPEEFALSLGQAADHILSMKILRKLKNRHDILPRSIDDLRKTLESTWTKLDRGAGSPERSLALLDAELNRLSHGGDTDH